MRARCVCSLQLCLLSAQMERLINDDGVEEKGERARMVRLLSSNTTPGTPLWCRL